MMQATTVRPGPSAHLDQLGAHPTSANTSWEFRLLGTLEVRRDGRRLPISAAKQRVVLAALLVAAPHPVDSEQITEYLWDGNPPPAARTTVHSLVCRVRSTLEQRNTSDGQPTRIIETTPSGYLLRVKPSSIDLPVFRSLVANGRTALARGNPGMAEEQIKQALRLWRGAPLADVRAARLQLLVTPALREQQLIALETLFDAQLQLGRHSQVAAELPQVLTRAPLRERFHQQLMRALHGADRQAEAIMAYHALRHRLVDELGVEPSRRTQQVYRELIAARS